MQVDHSELNPAACDLSPAHARCCHDAGCFGLWLAGMCALASEAGRIVWLGNNDSVPTRVASGARLTIDCAGALLTPV